MTITSTAGAVRRAYAQRMARWDRGLANGMRRVAITAERKQVENLTGSGPPRSYPVPVRTGNLRRGSGMRAGPRSAMVFNTAHYARAVHNGHRPYGNPRAARVRAREFLLDAVKATPAIEIVRDDVRKVLR